MKTIEERAANALAARRDFSDALASLEKAYRALDGIEHPIKARLAGMLMKARVVAARVAEITAPVIAAAQLSAHLDSDSQEPIPNETGQDRTENG